MFRIRNSVTAVIVASSLMGGAPALASGTEGQDDNSYIQIGIGEYRFADDESDGFIQVGIGDYREKGRPGIAFWVSLGDIAFFLLVG